MFTDGSSWYKDGSGGWAWLAFGLNDGEAWDSGGVGDSTNNQMEMLAWVEGLNALFAAFGPLTIVLYSDSEYVGLGATDRTRNRKKNRNLWKKIDAAMDQHEYVEWIHVKGHAGHTFNERVDKLASAARKAHRDRSAA